MKIPSLKYLAIFSLYLYDPYSRVLGDDGALAGFCHRLHFFVEWLGAYKNAQ